MDVKQTFATRLKTLREEKGISQAELGAAIGMTRGSISFYESGSRTPDIETLDRVHQYFQVSVNYLLGYSEAGKEDNEAIGEQLGLSDAAIELLRLCNQYRKLAEKYPKKERDKSYRCMEIINQILELFCHNEALLCQTIDCMEMQRKKQDDHQYNWFETEGDFINRYPEAAMYLRQTGAEVLFRDQAELFHLQKLKELAGDFFEYLVKLESGIERDRELSKFMLIEQSENRMVRLLQYWIENEQAFLEEKEISGGKFRKDSGKKAKK